MHQFMQTSIEYFGCDSDADCCKAESQFEARRLRGKKFRRIEYDSSSCLEFSCLNKTRLFSAIQFLVAARGWASCRLQIDDLPSIDNLQSKIGNQTLTQCRSPRRIGGFSRIRVRFPLTLRFTEQDHLREIRHRAVILEWEEYMSAKQSIQNFLSRACLQIADRSRRRSPRRAFRIELLETRALLATFTVTSNSDSGAGSLRNMISLANDTVGPDVIVFSPSTNGVEFDLSSTSISIAGSLTITGNGAALTVIDAQLMSQIFDIKNTAVNVTISNVTLKNGRTTGTNGTVDNEFSGGAIRSNLTGTLTINQSTLSGNQTTGANANGGAIYSATGAVVINQSTLFGNSTSGATSTGGAITSLSGAISVNGSTISGNSTTGDLGYGGAIASESGAITVTNSTLSGNFTTKIGAAGGAIASGSGAVTIRQSTLSGNSTAGQSASGGAIGSSSGTVVISQSTLSGNSTAGASANGGAIATFSSPVTVSQSTISGNQVTAPGTVGGGLWSDASPVTIVNSTITSNSATGSGGGLRGGASQKLTIRNSIIAANAGSSSNPDFTSPLSPATNLEVRHSLIGRNNGTSLTQTSTIPDANGNLVGGDNPGAAINPQLGSTGRQRWT
jgi:hypothetical protein